MLPPEVVVRICELVRAGRKKQDVAKELGIGRLTVNRLTRHCWHSRIGPERNAFRLRVLRAWEASTRDGPALLSVPFELGIPQCEVIAMFRSYEREQAARAVARPWEWA